MLKAQFTQKLNYLHSLWCICLTFLLWLFSNLKNIIWWRWMKIGAVKRQGILWIWWWSTIRFKDLQSPCWCSSNYWTLWSLQTGKTHGLSQPLSHRWNVCPGAHPYITDLIPTAWPRPVPWSDVTNGIIPCRQDSDPGPAKLPALAHLPSLLH